VSAVRKKTPAVSAPIAPPPEDDEDRYSITDLAGFLRFAEGPARARPPDLTRAQMAGMSGRALDRHNDWRRVWTANIGPLDTPQLKALHADLWEVVDAAKQDGNLQKPAVLVDAYSGLGKTTALLDFLRDFHRKEVAGRGLTTADGHRRVPAAYIDLSGNTQIRGLNAALCRFYRLPSSGGADVLGARAKDAVLALDTRVFVIDDLHFLAPVRPNEESARMTNQLKHLANTFRVVLIYAGVEVIARGIRAGADDASQKALNEQFGRHTTRLTMRPFRIHDEEGRLEWRQLLKSIEMRLVLVDRYQGMLADDLSDYLFARSTGHFQSLMTLITRGCSRAIRTEREVLDVEVMDKVNNDLEAEANRKDMEAKFAEGLISSRPGRAGLR
jgi:hypothetical protein